MGLRAWTFLFSTRETFFCFPLPSQKTEHFLSDSDLRGGQSCGGLNPLGLFICPRGVAPFSFFQQFQAHNLANTPPNELNFAASAYITPARQVLDVGGPRSFLKLLPVWQWQSTCVLHELILHADLFGDIGFIIWVHSDGFLS